MAVTDPVADMLARIRNAAMARHETTRIPNSKMKLAIAQILKQEGYIADVRDAEGTHHPELTIALKYEGRDRDAAFHGLKRVSRPGRRVYVGYRQIPRVLDGLGVSILSTSRGIMTDKDARTKKLGGEVLCEVW